MRHFHTCPEAVHAWYDRPSSKHSRQCDSSGSGSIGGFRVNTFKARAYGDFARARERVTEIISGLALSGSEYTFECPPALRREEPQGSDRWAEESYGYWPRTTFCFRQQKRYIASTSVCARLHTGVQFRLLTSNFQSRLDIHRVRRVPAPPPTSPATDWGEFPASRTPC